MTEPRKIKTLKDTNYFAHGTYKRQFKDYIIDIGLVNIITKTLLAPIERWRIIKQTQVAYPLRPLTFNNFFNYLSRIPKEQGFLSIWRGNLAGIWLYLTQTVIQIGLYDNFKNLQKELTAEQQQGSFFRVLTERMFIPILSTFFTQVITYPIDTARVRITMNFTKQKKNFPFFGIRQQNFSAMYRGFLLSNAISLINFNLYLAFASVASDISLGAEYNKFVNGDTIAAVSALILLHPLDTLKKIVQLNNLSSPVLFKNGRSAITYLKREASLGALYNGMTASVLKSLMFMPTYFLVQEGIKESKKIKF